jgi:predicted nucleic acid-binding protein
MKLKIYLDTSVISALFDGRNPDRQLLTELFFAQIPQYEVYISQLTVDEIDKTKNRSLKQKMQLCASSFTVMGETQEIITLANELVQYNAVPQKSIEDAYHIAYAVVSRVDYLLSWNFRHLVRLRTKNVVRMVTTLQGYRYIEIIAPVELIEFGG